MKSRRATAVVLAMSLATVALAGCKDSTATNSAAGHPAGATSTPASGGGASAATAAPVDVCSLLSAAQASSLVGKYPYSASHAMTIATGQDQCTYTNTGPLPDMVVIVYEPNSGVDFSTLTGASGADTAVSGVGDKAMSGGIELDVQTGDKIIAVQAAGGVGYGGSFTGAIAVAKAIISGLQ